MVQPTKADVAKRFLLVCLYFVLCACAGGDGRTVAAPPSVERTARLIIYRPPAPDLSMRKAEFFIDGEKRLALMDGRYAELALSPWAYTVGQKWDFRFDDHPALQVQLEVRTELTPDRPTFVELRILRTLSGEVKVELLEVNQATGEKGVARCRKQ